MSDGDYDVRNEIFNILNSKKMKDLYVSDLQRQFSSDFTNVHENVVGLLAKVKSKKSLRILKARLKEESDPSLKSKISSVIENWD